MSQYSIAPMSRHGPGIRATGRRASQFGIAERFGKRGAR